MEIIKVIGKQKRYSFKSIDKLAERKNKDKDLEAEEIIESSTDLEEAEEKLDQLK